MERSIVHKLEQNARRRSKSIGSWNNANGFLLDGNFHTPHNPNLIDVRRLDFLEIYQTIMDNFWMTLY